MTPEELKIIDTAIKIGFGGLIGVLTSAIAGFITYKTAVANSQAKLKEKNFESNELILKESLLHINNYHSKLSQYLYHIEHIHLLADNLEDNGELIGEQKLNLEEKGEYLFETGNVELSLAASKVLFVGLDETHKQINKYDDLVDKFLRRSNLASDNLKIFRENINSQFKVIIKQLSDSRKNGL